MGVGLGEELWLHRKSGFPLPYCMSRGKVGLKTAKTHLQMLSLLYFIKLALTLQAVLEAGQLELCVLWRDVAGAGQDFPLRLLLHWSHHP